MALNQLTVPGESKFKEIMNQHQPSVNSLWELASPRKESITESFQSVYSTATIEKDISDLSPVAISEKKIIRKIDWSILPILFCAYFLQFLDKVVYNVSQQYLLVKLS